MWKIGHEQVAALGRHLRNITNLQELDLSENEVGDIARPLPYQDQVSGSPQDQ